MSYDSESWLMMIFTDQMVSCSQELLRCDHSGLLKLKKVDDQNSQRNWVVGAQAAKIKIQLYLEFWLFQNWSQELCNLRNVPQANFHEVTIFLDVEGEERVLGSSGSLCMKGTLSIRKSTRATYSLLPPPRIYRHWSMWSPTNLSDLRSLPSTRLTWRCCICSASLSLWKHRNCIS